MEFADMRYTLISTAAVAFLAAFGGAWAVDESFPPVSDLPSHPELPDSLVTFKGERLTKEQWF
jgi:hypothetical protein